MKILTVVVPTYNMEKYLGKCLDSFVEETNRLFYAIEILIVNDGSKDQSVQIAERYVKKYPQVFRLINKQNGGHGSTINRGIKEATGKYFRVVDSDDWVDKNNFFSYLEKLEKTDVDMVITPYCEMDERTGHKKKFYYNTRGIKVEDCIDIDEFLKNRIPMMSTITYKTTILKDNNISIDEHCFYVDNEYVIYPLKYVKTSMLLKEHIYMYRINLTTQSCSDVGFIKHASDHEKVALHILSYISNEINNKLSKSVRIYYLRESTRLLEYQYRIYLMEKLCSTKSKAKLLHLDSKIRNLNRRIYNVLNKEKYIAELRKTHFQYLIIHKLKFNWLRKKGVYKGLNQ